MDKLRKRVRTDLLTSPELWKTLPVQGLRPLILIPVRHTLMAVVSGPQYRRVPYNVRR